LTPDWQTDYHIRSLLGPFPGPHPYSSEAISRKKPINKEKIVNFQKICMSALGAVMFLAGGTLAVAQGLVINRAEPPKFDVAVGNNLYCAGFVQTSPLYTVPREEANRPNKIVGAYNEQDGWNYSQPNYLLINGGANKGVQVGDMYSVIRPRGEVESRWTRKDRLGILVQELGVIQVVQVKPEVAVVRVRMSCDSMLLGDLLVPFETRKSAPFVKRPALDLFADASGKANGRIFLARDHQEVVSRDQIVYVDLGSEDSVAPGMYLTIYRPLGKGNLFINDEDESVSARDEGFQSDKYRGGKFSNQAARKYGSQANRRVVTTENAKKYRPEGLRKVVGEGMVVSVRERTATVVITRTAQEIHTGDWVEIQ
jgi:hypothetical protein